MTNTIANRIGPFHYADETCIARRGYGKGRQTYVIVLSSAYNACGLIGPERNGVAVLNETTKQVVCDGIARENTGYHGASERQREAFKHLLNCPSGEFRRTVEEHPNFRGVGF